MQSITLSDYHFFIFVIPGFITVWAFRYFTKSKKAGDFEFLGLSFFWGLMMLIILELITKQEKVKELLANPYAAAILLSVLGFSMGFFGSMIVKNYHSQKRDIKFIISRIKLLLRKK